MATAQELEVLKSLQAAQKDKEKEVILSGRELIKLPPEIGKLKFLRVLDVSRNELTELPSVMFETLKLEVLKANNNNLHSIPSSIGLCKTLTVVHLSRNKLKELPDSFCELENLTEVYLNENILNSLPKYFGNLHNLVVLHMRDNPSLIELPPTFGQLKSLIDLFVDQDKYRTPPNEVVKSGTKHILQFMKDLENGGVPCYRVKLLVVGQENVGKTSLIHRLNGKQKKTISTDGIDIKDVVVKSPVMEKFGKKRDQKITFAAWDFAGQELYYTTHQFFMSQRGVYIVTWDIRYPEENSRVEYWLQSIQARVGKDAPILIVGTHIDDPSFAQNTSKADDLSQHLVDRFHSRFPNIKAIWLVSNSTGQGIETLRDKLATISMEMPHMGEIIPRTYLLLEEHVQKLKEKKNHKKIPPIASWQELSSVASQHCCIHTQEELLVAVTFLHNMGTLLYFEEGSSNLKNIVILDPAWLTELMASLITTKHRFIKDGILGHIAIPQIWKSSMFPKKLHQTFLELFETFEISYRLPTLPGEEERSLFPSLLPDGRPSNIDQLWPDYEPQLITYARQYKLDFIPTGFFSRLMIRLLQFMTAKVYWKSGIVFTEKSGLNKGFTELIPDKNRLNVTVRGLNPAKLLRTISEIIDILLTYWYRVDVEQFVPCIHCHLKKDPHPFRFYLKECEAAAYKGDLTIECRGKDKIRLDQLVPDVAMTEKEQNKIDHSKLIIEKLIGKGGFGTISKGRYKESVVAVKEISQPEETDDSEKLRAFNEFRKEVFLMSELKHRNIVELKGFTMNPFCMVMEFLEGGDLYEFIHDEKINIDWNTRIRLATDIALGMEFLHSITPPLIHRDLKSPNVLLTSRDKNTMEAKVADFGLSNRLFINAFKQTNLERSVGNPTWLAPEVMKEEEFSEKADVYAFGIIIWELLTRKHPFDEYDFKMTYMLEDAIKNGKRPSMPSDCPSPKYIKLIQDCWAPDPDARPTFKVVLEVLYEIDKELLVLGVTDLKGKSRSSHQDNKSRSTGSDGRSSKKNSKKGSKKSSRGSGKEGSRSSLKEKKRSSRSKYSDDEDEDIIRKIAKKKDSKGSSKIYKKEKKRRESSSETETPDSSSESERKKKSKKKRQESDTDSVEDKIVSTDEEEEEIN